jgi:hypothetical protein
MLCWLKALDGERAHICMVATGRHSSAWRLRFTTRATLVSIVNPAQIRDFARTKLGRNKTDKVDAALIREYVELFKPGTVGSAIAGHAATMRAAKRARRPHREPDGVYEPHRMLRIMVSEAVSPGGRKPPRPEPPYISWLTR